MNDQEENNCLGEMVFDGDNQGENHGRVWDKPAPDPYLCFCP